MLSLVSRQTSSITSWLSIPSDWERIPTSLANVTLRAWKVLLTYFSISAVSMGRAMVPDGTRVEGGSLAVITRVASDQREWRIVVVVHRLDFAKELGVEADSEPFSVLLSGRLLETRQQKRTHGSGQYRAADDYQVPRRFPGDAGADDLTDALKRGKIDPAVRLAGGADGYQRDIGFRHGFRAVVGGAQTARGDGGGDDLADLVLDDRAAAVVDCRDLLAIYVDPHDLEAVARETTACYGAHISEAEDAYTHRYRLLFLLSPYLEP